MALTPGTQLGSFELVALIGAGAMGEVYRARDPKLNRMVAIKVLPKALADNADLLARFEREARAVAALNHPNILGIHDFVRGSEHTYAVMELLDGETFRDRLKAGPMAPRKAIEIAQQMAEGLIAAHAKGIIHRDLKPENLFLTREGRVKILDFGLAKQLPAWSQARGPDGAVLNETLDLVAPGTEAGMIMGTVGYMSPEQVKGEAADHRSDIFAFGVVLYELLSGRPCFKKDTAVGTMNAILEEDPAELTGSRAQIPPGLERLIFHCLEKHPDQRFQSMRDLAYELANLGSIASTPPGRSKAQHRNRRPLLYACLATLAGTVLLGGLLAAFHLPPFAPRALPTFKRITFAPGTVEAACFGPDGRSIFYSARIAGAKPEVFGFHPGDAEPKALGLPDTLLLGVSPGNELLVLRHPTLKIGALKQGVLAKVASGGGAVRELQAEVAEAASDAQGLAALLTLDDHSQTRLEFPLGRTLLDENASIKFYHHMRLAPDGREVAFVSHDNLTDAKIEAFDRSGHRRMLYTVRGDNMGESITGLAWGPGGALWFSEIDGDQTVLWALSPGGRRRMLWRSQGLLQILDVSPEGRMLLAVHQVRRGALLQKAGQLEAQDLSIQSGTQIAGLSADGSQVLLMESPAMDGGTIFDRAYLRPTDGGPPLSLARGAPRTLSPDGKWVHLYLVGQDAQMMDPALAGTLRRVGLDPATLLDPQNPKPCLLFVPTGLDHPWALALPPSFEDADAGFVFPDGQRVGFYGWEKGEGRMFQMDRRGGAPLPLTPKGYARWSPGLVPLSPDGTRLIVTGDVRNWFTVPIPPVPGQQPRPIPGILAGERVLCWAADNRSIFVRSELSALPVALNRVDTVTGVRTFVQNLATPDRAGHIQTRNVYLTPDARTIAFDFDRRLSELYLVEGIN